MTNEFLQRVIIEALESGEYTLADIRDNVETATERYEQYRADEDDSTPDPEQAKILVFAVAVEMDQESPHIGEVFDVSNDRWDWLDVRYAGAMADGPLLPKLIRDVL